MQQFLGQSLSLVDSMSFWSMQYIDTEDYQTKSAEMFVIVTFAEEFNGVPNPIEALQMKMDLEECVYDEEFTIELPEEALNAQPMELPELPADFEQSVSELEE